MKGQQDPIYNQGIAACESHHIKKLMGLHYDWNIEIIAQFYATLYIKEAEGVRKMHWMTEGEWYNIGYGDFASRFSFRAADTYRPRIHIHDPLEEEEMKPMYALGQEMNVGSIYDLYTYYSVLNRLFRRTICLRDGDPTNIF
jgi:hypothetical protein